MKRSTIRWSVRLSGAGLLSRRRASVTLKPGVPGQGIVFNENVIATPGQASVIEHTTCLGQGRNRVGMVEHLLAACAGLGVTDLGVRVAGGELPFLDGSARPYFAALMRAGLVTLGVEVVPVAVVGALTVRRGDSVISVQPASRLAVACRFGRSELRLSVNPRSFEQHVAGARTFGPLDEPLADFRRRHNLRYALSRRGGIVFPMRERMPHEPVRHKILDLIGDLWLLGCPLHADVAAVAPNHELNIALARELEAS